MLGMKRSLAAIATAILGAATAVVLSATTFASAATKTTTTKTTTTKTTTTTTTPTSTPPSTLGSTVELGLETTPITAPVCPPGVAPASCTIIMTRTTGLETIRDSVAYPTKVKESGYLVAWKVGLSRLSTSTTTAESDITFLNGKYGGVAEAQITVLKPVKSTRKHKVPRFSWEVAAEGPVQKLQPYLGSVVQFPLTTPIPVTKGETVALSVPTWAPVLTYDLPTKKFAYRQSRKFNCNNPGGLQNAQLTVNKTAVYACNYPGTRVEYSATEVTTPSVPKNHL